MEHIDRHMLESLAPKAEELTTRHIQTRKIWMPHQFVPWTLGRDYEKSYEWQADDFPMPDEVRSALFVNLLTEDNLPFYVRDIDEFAGKDGIWRHWTGIWTYEEQRHSYAMRTYIEATRAIDPVTLEKAREVQVVGGEVPRVESTIDGFVYVSLQELATRIAHLKTGQKLRELGNNTPNDRHQLAAIMGYNCLQRIAADENFHYLFYRDLVSEAITVDPSKVVLAIKNRVENFAMPGTGIPGFNEHAKKIAKAGIYNPAIHYQDILVPVVLRHWKVGNITGLTSEAAQAQDDIMNRMERLGKIAARLNSRQGEAALIKQIN